MSDLTVVMYHYVRELERSRFPRIKGLTVEQFRGQLRYFSRHFHFVNASQVLAATRGEENLPPDSLLLTFDDGYLDHFRYVFPLLSELGVEGVFFPPASVLTRRVVLDVNKVHFALASAPDVREVAAFCLDRMEALREEFSLRPTEEYVRELSHASHLDDATTIMVKRLLQHALPGEARRRLANELFARFVTADEAAFAEELYLTLPQARTMYRNGMQFGNHGSEHVWLNHVDVHEQKTELEGGCGVLRAIGVDPGDFMVAYPYGGVDESVRSLAEETGHRLGFTVVKRVCRIPDEDPLLIPRFDTVDFPFDEKS